MATGQIRMTPETMRIRAKAYKTQAENVDNVIKSMDNLLTTLMTEWEGASSQAYNEKYASLRPGFIAAKDLINDIAKALEQTATAVERTDSDIASQFRA